MEEGKELEVVRQKRVLSPEHLAKMKEGRIRSLASRGGKRTDIGKKIVREDKDRKSIRREVIIKDAAYSIAEEERVAQEQSKLSPEIRVPKKDLKFYGEGDLTRDGKIASEYPAHYFGPQIEDMEEEVKKMESRVARGVVPVSELDLAKKAINREKEKLDRIYQAQGEIKGHEDILNKNQKKLGEKIRDAMYNRSDGEKGLSDPHEVAERWVKPCIEISSEMRILASKANVQISSDGKVSQIGAEKIWKLCRAGLGESTNTEMLRRG